MRARRQPAGRRGAGIWAALLLAAAAGRAAPPSEVPPPTFFIETITVEVERLSPEIVLAESLLRAGREYSEAELSQAVHRIHRLPAVLLAEFSLRRGSERGRYELVVEVYEARRWFSQLALGLATNDAVDRFRVDGFGDGFFRTGDGDDLDALIGRRFAVGRRGLLFASFGTEAGLFAVGYQRYDLWNRNVLLSLTLAGENQAGARSRAARAQLGIPLGGNHALRLLAGWSRSDYSSSFFVADDETREAEVEIAWVFNSLDDPVLPRQGSLLELGLAGSRREERRVLAGPDGGELLRKLDTRRGAVVASASRHWPLGARQSVSVDAGGVFGGSDPGQRWQGEVGLGHQLFLLRHQEPGRWRELRLESRLAGRREELSGFSGFPGSGPGGPGLPDALETWSLRAGLTYRTGWGLFRLFVEHAERSFE